MEALLLSTLALARQLASAEKYLDSVTFNKIVRRCLCHLHDLALGQAPGARVTADAEQLAVASAEFLQATGTQVATLSGEHFASLMGVVIVTMRWSFLSDAGGWLEMSCFSSFVFFPLSMSVVFFLFSLDLHVRPPLLQNAFPPSLFSPILTSASAVNEAICATFRALLPESTDAQLTEILAALEADFVSVGDAVASAAGASAALYVAWPSSRDACSQGHHACCCDSSPHISIPVLHRRAKLKAAFMCWHNINQNDWPMAKFRMIRKANSRLIAASAQSLQV